MTYKTGQVAFLASLLCLLSQLSCTVQTSSFLSPHPVAITNVNVIPMDKEQVIEHQTVLIEEGRITRISHSDSVSLPPETHSIDGTNRFLIPGFADMHAHARRIPGHRPEDYLREGVTLIRNMQGEPSHLAYREEARENGGPLFFTAGQALAGYQIDKSHRIVKTAEEGRKAVREQKEAGYDYIKVYSFLSLETYDAIMEEAAKLGIAVVGHVPDDVRANHAIASGQSSIEHLFGYFWELESDTSPIRGEWFPRRLFHAVEIDSTKLEEIAERTAQAGVWNCPTLWRKDNYLTYPPAEKAWNTQSLRDLGHSNRMKLVKALHDAGAGLLLGTDDKAEIVHEEMALFAEAGLSNFEVLQVATVNAAHYLGLYDEIGTIEVGKRADLVLLGSNPLENIRYTDTVIGVLVNGTWLPNPDNPSNH